MEYWSIPSLQLRILAGGLFHALQQRKIDRFDGQV
jgi:hypothetical protein